ncbi:MAG: esterase/lipase family protein, partial [Microcoleus sp.]
MLVQRSSSDTERTSPVLEERCEATDGLGRPVHYVVYQPNIRLIEADRSQSAIVLANGWTAGKSIMGRTAAWLASQGRTAIVFDHHREAQSIEHPEEHKMLTLAATVEDYCQEYGEDMVEIIAHSEGGINSTMYATLDREAKTRRVKSLTQVSPAGYLDLSPSRLLFRGGQEVASLLNLGQVRNIGRLAIDGRDIGEYLSRNIGLSRREVGAIAHSHVLPAAEALYNDGLRGG